MWKSVKLFPFAFPSKVSSVKKFERCNMTSYQLIHVFIVLINKAVMKTESECCRSNGNLCLRPHNKNEKNANR